MINDVENSCMDHGISVARSMNESVLCQRRNNGSPVNYGFPYEGLLFVPTSFH